MTSTVRQRAGSTRSTVQGHASWAVLVASICLLGSIASSLSGCASHSANLFEVRESLLQGDLDNALLRFEGQKEDLNDLLYLLEKGYLLHLSGAYAESNLVFAAAEERADELYTRSISREILSLATSDNTRAYRGLPYELQLVQYYRALNYIELGKHQEALVEARKANEFVERYRDEEEDDPERFRQNAFLDCVSGWLYESEGEYNDAIVSFRNAWRAFTDESDRYGLSAPQELAEAYHRGATRLGNRDEAREISDSFKDSPLGVSDAAGTSSDDAQSQDVVRVLVFFESGFVPHRESVDITLPIFDQEADSFTRALLYSNRYGPHIYSYTNNAKLQKVLRFSFPRLEQVPSAAVRAELVLPDGTIFPASPVLDLASVAESEFNDALPGALFRTVARAFTKEATRKAAAKESDVLGWLVNAVNVATEQADTRSWIFLPGRIDVAEAVVPAGTQNIRARFLDRFGGVIDEWTLDLDEVDLGTRFVSLRSFR